MRNSRPWTFRRSTILVASRIVRRGMASRGCCSWGRGGEVAWGNEVSVADVVCRSGKSSISSVVFHKLPPSETLYLETTYRIKKESMQYVLYRYCLLIS
jgi:hypothetical protein